MQAHGPCRLFFLLLVFPFIIGKFEVAIASPLHALKSKSPSNNLKFTRKVSKDSHTRHWHHNHATFTRPKSVPRLGTVVTGETRHAYKPHATELVTDIVKKYTKPPTSATLSDLGTSRAHIPKNTPSLPISSSTIATSTASTTSPTSSGKICAVPSTVSSSPAVNSVVGSPPTALPQITERRFFELPTATLVGVAIAGSVAANLAILVLWLLLGHKCSRKPTGAVAAGEELGPVDDTEKEQQISRDDVITEGTPGLLMPRGASPVRIDSHTPPSTRQPLPMPLSSFWSAPPSQWTLEHARSNDHEAHLDELQRPRHFTTFSLDTPVNPHLNSPVLTTHTPGTILGSENQKNTFERELSPEEEQDHLNLTVPPPVHPSRGDSSTDPRSPRRLSIPVFIENYSAPSIARYLPPQTQSTIITSNEGNSYRLDPRGMLQDRKSSRRVVEDELGPGSVATSRASLASLPSVSSDVMTPRRHWTFVDIHGPSAQPISPQGFEGILDRFSGTGSSRTLAGDVHGASAEHFQVGSSSSQAPFSEPLGTDSFLHTDLGISIGSGISQCRSVDTRCDTLHSFDHSIRTH